MNKNALKRMIALVMAVMLAVPFAGCQSGSQAVNNSEGGTAGNTSEGATGRWVEKEITPEGICYVSVDPIKMEDGTLVMIGKPDSWEGQLTKYISNDEGDTWTTEELDWEEQTGGIISVVSLLPSGTALVSSIQYDESKENVENMSVFAYQNGTFTKMESLENKDIYNLELLDEETAFISGMKGMGEALNLLVNIKSGEIIKEIEDSSSISGAGSMIAFALDTSEEDNPYLYYAQFDANGMILSSMDKTGKIDDNPISIKSDGGCGSTDEAGNYYFVNDGGICRIVKDGKIQEQIMDDEGYQLGLSNNYCSGMSYISDTSFICVLMVMSGSDSTKIVKYVWDPNATSETTSTIKVWSLNDDSTIKEAIVSFKASNPEVEVIYEVGMSDESVNPDDVIRSLNTQFISGSGPDVVMFDGLSYENYVENGYLCDLSDTVDFSLLKENIVSPFIDADGKCYVIPTRFSAPCIMGNVGDVENIKTLDDLKAAVLACKPRPGDDCTKEAYYEEWTESECYGLGIINVDQLVDFALKTSACVLIEDGQINHENLTKIMDFVGTIGTYYGMDKYPDDVIFNDVCGSSDSYDAVYSGDGGYEYNITRHAQYGWGEVATPAFFTECRRDYREKTSQGTLVSQPGLVENAYTPLSMLAVNASSKESEIAKKFVATVLSEDVQKVNYGEGNAVLTSALEANIEKHADYVKEYGYEGDMNTFFDSLKTPVTVTGNTEVLRDYIVNHATAMIKGEETLEQAVTGVESDMKLLLEEQK